MTLRKFLKLWGAAGAPNFFSVFVSATAAEGGNKWAPFPRKAREIPPKAGVSASFFSNRLHTLSSQGSNSMGHIYVISGILV